MFGSLLASSVRILWRTDGSMITPNGIRYVPEENEFKLPFDMPKLEPDEKRELPD